ncbi:MAG: hypothetical protein MI725_02605 [Pirellulales bacterium]|nr:hypothetical protein [Pirellulales bacterium]
MNKNYVWGTALILALLVGTGWAVGLFADSQPDPEVLEAIKMREEAMKKLDSKNPQSWREQYQDLREKVQSFSDEQKRSFRESGRKFFMQKVDDILAMPPEQQRAELDKWIDFMESARKTRQAGGGRQFGPPGGRPGGSRPELSQAERDQRRKQRLDRSTPEMRAKMDQVIDLVNERREERGLEPMQGRGR